MRGWYRQGRNSLEDGKWGRQGCSWWQKWHWAWASSMSAAFLLCWEATDHLVISELPAAPKMRGNQLALASSSHIKNLLYLHLQGPFFLGYYPWPPKYIVLIGGEKKKLL